MKLCTCCLYTSLVQECNTLRVTSPRRALHQEGLFRVNGNVRAVAVLKQRLESGEDVNFLDEADVCTVASLLKQYLRDLPEGLVDSSVQTALIQQHQQSSEDRFCSGLREILHRLPDVHYSLLRYLCVFLAQVDRRHGENRMTALNLATVFGPNVFHVSSGFDGIQEQNICNKIMAKLIQDYVVIFNHSEAESPEPLEGREETAEPTRDVDRDVESGDAVPDALPSNLIIVKEAVNSLCNGTDPIGSETTPSSPAPSPKISKNTPTPRKNETASESTPANTKESEEPPSEHPISTMRKKKVRKVRREPGAGLRAVPVPNLSTGLPHFRPLPISPVLPGHRSSNVTTHSPERMEVSTEGARPGHQDDNTVEMLSSSREDDDDRPISPFYMSHLSPVQCRPDLTNVLEKTIRSAVEQHLFDVRMFETCERITGGSESSHCCLSSPVTTTARQRRRHQREQEEAQRQRDRSSRSESRSSSLREGDTNKENIPARGSVSGASPVGVSMCEEGWRGHCQTSRERFHHKSLRPKTPRDKTATQSSMLTQVGDSQDTLKEGVVISRAQGGAWTNGMDSLVNGSDGRRQNSGPPLTLSRTRIGSMKIQEQPGSCETAERRGLIGRSSDPECGESREDVPRLDLTALTEDKNWGEPVPAYSSWQRESMAGDEACISPQVGGRLIRQLIEEDSDPMLSPRFHAYGHCQHYLDDTEVPPSPPNSHSFSRRRSSSLGSCGDDDREELTSAQLSKKVHGLKRKIRKYEERFEEERKYRPSHSDKADNPEVLKWMNELERLKKDLKEHKLHKSEEDLPTMTRQRSNTLPKSFGSQLEKKPPLEKDPKPPVESTLEVVQVKLQEKRKEVGRPEDIKDMTREQISGEKVALQKALLYYEGIHGRPVTKIERQIMKPLYDRYRLVKQILCRASTIPVIGSPSSKRRGPLLQPIIEGEPALFFDDIKEEEDGSEDESGPTNMPQSPLAVTERPDLSMIGFLDQLEEETDGFISPVDDLSPSKNASDMRLSNLHSATMPELVEQLQEAREEKKIIRKNLREFEEQFMRQNGRNVQKEDRSPLAVEYNEYKHIKAKLRLLEVLISKRDVSKFI
ncbi:hypothetical protein DPEC_G00183220 [Dallia pectoralis]|uniref:Uncharacterized protein n=1 Tax=Dallia pectoralis TaxID=75939 RepID=A0ACC2GAN0_DALPE|nr:hypothetical protein DPEC_G00183220 [Dallia pectoralis]